MSEFFVFCVLFGLFMYRAYLLDWKSIFSSDTDDENVHIGSLVLAVSVLLVISAVVMLCLNDAKKLLATEYDGVYVTPEELRARLPRAEVGKTAFFDKAVCEEYD